MAGPSLGLEGAARPGHFDGVATVVAKLLLAVRPDRAVFGQKDAQQVGGRAAADGATSTWTTSSWCVGPIVREPDGLAMSSRNAYLDPDDRARRDRPPPRPRGRGRPSRPTGERDAARIEAAARAVIEAEPRCALEYAAVVDPGTFAPPRHPGGPRPARRRRPRGSGPPHRQRAPAPHHADEHDPTRPVADGDLSYAGAPTSRENR